MNQETKGLIGLVGILSASMTVGLNSQVTSIALADIRGGLGLSRDAASWFGTLYIAGEVVGMTMATWWAVTLSFRRFALGVIALCFVSSLAIPFTSNLLLLYPLRILQGLAEGATVPLLMSIALRVLPPPIRLYGLAAYVLTATFFPYLGATAAALWVDVLDWRFAFFQVIPLCALAAVLVWFGIPAAPPQYHRLRLFDWRGALLIIVGFSSLTVVLTQGDRLDWFNSQTISALTLTTVVTLPLLLVNECFQKQPFLKLQLLARRNLAFAAIGLFLFLLISAGALELPLNYLEQVQGFRPAQAHGLTLLVALSQLIMLPVMPLLLNRAWVDARMVIFTGLLLILLALIGDTRLNASWQAGQFITLQALQAIGAPMVVVSLLMIGTNTVKPEEGPFASALLNTPRALAEATAIWLVQLILRERSALHLDRLGSQLAITDQTRTTGGLGPLAQAVRLQAAVLTLADAFWILAALTCVMMLVVVLLPKRTYPPRIALAQP